MEKASNDIAKLLLRVTVGGLMIFHGISKLANGIPWLAGAVTGAGLPEFFMYGVYIGEVVGPLLLISGYQTRIGALLVVVDMLFALFLVHKQQIFSLNHGGGWAIELPMFFLLASLAVFFAGGGKFRVWKASDWPKWG
jgi:putative oxidoreductase